jgi:uncharacterized protein (TIGR02246 family)
MPHPVVGLYQSLIDGWNARDADAMAQPFAPDGVAIGYDGSVHAARDSIAEQMRTIFRDHPTARYVTEISAVRELGPAAVLLRAIAGLVPPGRSDVKADVNAHHTVVAERDHDHWQIVLFQNTPAQFHGRPELVAEMTRRLQQVADGATAGPCTPVHSDGGGE